MKNCSLCGDLLRHRTQVVLPIVDENPLLFFMGEAPGASEDKAGVPFVGAAGKYHQRFIEALGNPPKVVCNVINCRPTILSETGRVINGKPTEQQIQNCSRWVDELIVTHMPSCKLMILYGLYPIQRFLPWTAPFKVSDYAGNFYTITHAGVTFEVFACYHPATLVYNYKYFAPKWKEIVLKLKEHLNDKIYKS